MIFDWGFCLVPVNDFLVALAHPFQCLLSISKTKQKTMFCTYLTIYHGNKLPLFYIGSTSLGKLSRGYHGSVSSEYRKIWLAELRNNPEKFITKVITTHNTRESALNMEEKLQRRLRVVESPLHINMSYANRGFVKQGPSSEATKAKLKEAWKTRPPLTAQQRENIKSGQQNRKPVSPETSAKNIALILNGYAPLK